MVMVLRQGASQRAVARMFGVSLRAVQHWTRRAQGLDLDAVDWSDHRDRPHCVVNRSSRELEDLVLKTRQELRDESDLGEFGAAAIHRALLDRRLDQVPALRTINRILERRGALDGQRRIRRQAPPRGWYLPDVAGRQAELDEFDIVEGLLIQGGPEVAVLNAISLHGGSIGSWPAAGHSAQSIREALLAHWREFGLPAYVQFDNDTRFQGPHQHPDTIGSVTRLCLSLQVVPVFVVPREPGFQAAIEGVNGLWQAKVWARFHHESLAALQAQSAKYVAAHRLRSVARRDTAPERRPFPEAWQLDLQAQPRGRIVFVRRTDEHGQVDLLGHSFTVDDTWLHRLVRCDVELNEGVIRFYALRRQAPIQQPLLKEAPYVLPHRHFRE